MRVYFKKRGDLEIKEFTKTELIEFLDGFNEDMDFKKGFTNTILYYKMDAVHNKDITNLSIKVLENMMNYLGYTRVYKNVIFRK